MENTARWTPAVDALNEKNLVWKCRFSFTKTIGDRSYDMRLEDFDSYWQVSAIFPLTVSKDDSGWFESRLARISAEVGCGCFELDRSTMSPCLRVIRLHDGDENPVDSTALSNLLDVAFKLLEERQGEIFELTEDWFTRATKKTREKIRELAAKWKRDKQDDEDAHQEPDS